MRRRQRLERELGRQYHLITRDDRLETVARFRAPFSRARLSRKAMVVSIDKPTAYRMYDKVQSTGSEERARVREGAAAPTSLGQGDELKERLKVLRTTDMAVVVSPGQNEIEQMKKRRHRRGAAPQTYESRAGLDEKFKDPDDPFRLVFVCAMWLTGFDAPSCSTIYLDKPMRNHTLMQTIARANRIYPGKQSGVIVDYANVFASLEKALAIYGKGRGVRHPCATRNELAEQLRCSGHRHDDASARMHGVDLAKIEAISPQQLRPCGGDPGRGGQLMAPEDLRRHFLSKVGTGRLHCIARSSPMWWLVELAATVRRILAAIAERIRTVARSTGYLARDAGHQRIARSVHRGGAVPHRREE